MKRKQRTPHSGRKKGIMDYFDDCSWYESDDVESWEEDACWIDSQYEAEEGDAEG